jgi:hypothetical protein
VGDLGTHGPPDSAGCVEIGYTLAPPARGKGTSPVIAQQQPTSLIMRDSTRPPGRAPLPVLLQGRRGLGALQLIRRCQPFQRPQPPVFRHRNDNSGFTAQMDHLGAEELTSPVVITAVKR